VESRGLVVHELLLLVSGARRLRRQLVLERAYRTPESGR
jgi:hypothetical protein